MQLTKFQKALYAFITVLITVHAYVFYSLYVINGSLFSSFSQSGKVLDGIAEMGGVGAFGTHLDIWAIVLIEFAFAYTLEMCMGQPLSIKLASKVFDPRTTHPVLFETAVICTTVGLMCPSMSFIAALIYYPYGSGFDFLKLLADWLKLVCYNFPFAFFTQLFFIQPFVRTIFKLIFRAKHKKPKRDERAEESN